MTNTRSGLSALTLALLALLTSCGGKESPTGPPVVANVTVTPGGDTLATLGRTRAFSASATDQNGNPVSASIRWHSTNAAVVTVDSMTGLVTAVGNGLAIVRATASGINGDAIVAVSQAVATVQVNPPSATVATVGATTQFTAVAKDSGGASVNGVTMLWISSDPSVAVVDTTGKATAQKSGHTTVTAAARGIPGNAGLTVNQLAKHLVFSSPPVLTVAGDAISPALQVEIRDSLGGLVSDSRIAVTIALAIHPAGAVLLGTKTVNAVGGVATFTGLAIEKADSQYSIVATAAAVPEDTSALFSVVPAPVSRVVFSVPDSVFNGGVISPAPSVTLYDRFGNFAYNAVDTITLEIASSTWGGSVLGPVSGVPVGGVAVFPGLRYSAPGLFTLRAWARGDTIGTASPIRQHITFKTIAVGTDHTCGLTASSTAVFCWGAGDQGQLGDGAFAEDSVPRLADTTVTFGSINASASGTCGLNAAGTAYCWGDLGMIGSGTPAPLGNLVPFASVDLGPQHGCGRTSAGVASCFGINSNGELGDSTTTSIATPVAVYGGLSFSVILAGGNHSCGLVSGAAYCWGLNLNGQLGSGNRDTIIVPNAVVGGHSFTALDVGGSHACGLVAGGSAYCWGNDFAGQAGDTLFLQADTVPFLVTGGLHFSSIATGATHTCGVSITTAFAYCWGTNNDGELGSNTFSGAVPTVVNGGNQFVQLGAATFRTCGLVSAGQVYCWGANDVGQGGDGTHVAHNSPTAVVQR